MKYKVTGKVFEYVSFYCEAEDEEAAIEEFESEYGSESDVDNVELVRFRLYRITYVDEITNTEKGFDLQLTEDIVLNFERANEWVNKFAGGNKFHGVKINHVGFKKQ